MSLPQLALLVLREAQVGKAGRGQLKCGDLWRVK